MRKSKKIYRRSTPVGRLRRNASKIARHATLVFIRLISWKNGVNSDKRLLEAEEIVSEILEEASRLDVVMGRLEKSKFVPPKRSNALSFEIGQHVAIGPKYRDKYGLVFAKFLGEDPLLLDDLVISNILPTGEVVVQRKQRTPFLVSKSHLVERSEDVRRK